jgi:hypothetical protein
MAAASTLARTAKIDKIGFSSAVLRSGRFDEFRNNLVPARNAGPYVRTSVQ